MPFANKSNGREYPNKSNSISNRIGTINYRNSCSSSQYSNISNGESYSHDEKSQHSNISPKLVEDSHGAAQHNDFSREPYVFKNNNSRIKQYNLTKNYSDRQCQYQNQRSCSPEDIIIPEIDNLRNFIVEQTKQFKAELEREENQKSSSPSLGSHQHEQSHNRYNKPQSGITRPGNGISSSHSLSSIANTSINIQPIQTGIVPSPCSDNSNRHPDVRMSQNPLGVIKSSSSIYNCAKQSLSNSGKPSPGLTRNLSHEEPYSKSIINNKNRNDSPNNTLDKPMINKTQFPSPTGTSINRHDSKRAFNNTKSHTYVSGSNAAMHQLNQNNVVPSMVVSNETIKNDQHPQQSRATVSATVREGLTNNLHTKPVNRRRTDTRDNETMSNCRAVVRIGNSTDSQHVSHSVTDTGTVSEQFFTPDPSASPCSTRSSPDTAAAIFQFQRGQKKTVTAAVVNTRVGNNNRD